MFNKILALLFIFIFNSNALADSITTFKCKFDLENYDYTINIACPPQPCIPITFLLAIPE